MKRLLMILLLLVPAAHAQIPEERFEAGGFVTGTLLREVGSRDSGTGTEAAGFGGRVVFRAVRFLDLETDIAVLPGNAASSGSRVQGLFGAKAGWRGERFGLFLKARPGFMYFTKDPFGASEPGSGIFNRTLTWEP